MRDRRGASIFQEARQMKTKSLNVKYYETSVTYRTSVYISEVNIYYVL